MSTNTNYELETLKEKIVNVYNGRVSTANDFIELAESINEKTGQLISDSTLKRIWGYVNYNPQPRRSTLDILSQYVGYDSFRLFCNALQKTSSFFSCEKIIVSELETGDYVCIGWAPDREVILEYLGDSRFRITDGGTSKLQKGDLVETAEFLQGVPLFFAKVTRNGEELPAYAAGKANGLSKLEIVYQ